METPVVNTPAVNKEQYEKAYQALIDRLDKDLPPHLTYHNTRHTIGVIEATEYLIKAERVPEKDRWLLLTAALYHDSGFLRGYKNHEELSCDLAWETLPSLGYANESIEHVCRLIMTTKLPQTPTDHYERIICDADLYYLGAPNFFATAESLFKEFKHEGIVENVEEWQVKQLQFLEHHHYFTQTAIAEREQKKKNYLKQLHLKWRIENRKKQFSERTTENIHDLFMMILGVIVASAALKSFLVPNHFFDGGITGISLLLHEIYHYNLAYVIVLANLPLLAIGYFSVSKRFASKTFLCVTLLGLSLLFFPFPAVLTQDRIIIAVFGGFFMGTGIGLCMRAGCALDGVEILALKTFKKTPFTVTEIILAINILIFTVAAFKLGIMTALYSILTYFTASKSIDYVVEGIEAYTGVTIISGQSELIKYRLVNELGRGITVYKGERGFLPGQFENSTECDIIFTVVTRLELRRLKNLVHETDGKAFVFANTIREASGGILRRRQAHN